MVKKQVFRIIKECVNVLYIIFELEKNLTEADLLN